MRRKIGNCEIEVVRGDITSERTDAIVNAANTSLLGGGGVDGAIHRAGGPAILEACRKLGGCETGDAKITTGGKLFAKYVIHTVGPVYHDGKHGEAHLLSSCHLRSLEVALRNNAKSVSFPAISCGVYGYPIPDAAKIALSAVAEFAQKHPGFGLIRFVLFSEDIKEVFEKALKALPEV
jgi:O-acetyl-ADP-ribose deacetylase (regulator of RNase III)